MKEEMTRQEMIKKLEELRTTEVDCYGLNKVDRSSKEEISQITEFDSFLFQDTLQLIGLSQEQIAQFRTSAETAGKFNSETQLYIVTISDLGTRYYDYATMLNRLTNQIYAGKVNKTKELLRQFAGSIKYQMTQKVESVMGAYQMTEAFRKDAERKK